MNKEKLVIISERDLDSLIFKASRSANEQLFKGIIPFISKISAENELIIETLDYIKTYMMQQDVKKLSLTLENAEANPKLSNLIDEMSDEDMGVMAQAIKNAVESKSVSNKKGDE